MVEVSDSGNWRNGNFMVNLGLLSPQTTNGGKFG